MGVPFFGRFMNAFQPPPGKQRPQQDRAGHDEEAETPGPVGGVGINSARADEREGDGKRQPANKVNADQN